MICFSVAARRAPSTPHVRATDPEKFSRGHHREGTAELLDRQQSERVAGENGHARTTDRGFHRTTREASVSERESCKAKVRLGLASSGGEPQQIADVPVDVGRIRHRGKVEELESDLERVPGVCRSTGPP